MKAVAEPLLFPISLGCAGWNVRREYSEHFPGSGSHLERYASRFNAVEINSTFKKSHLLKSYERWANSVPLSFRFSVKMPKEITHDRRFVDCEDVVVKFIDEVRGLGEKLGPVLIQLPASFYFDKVKSEVFFNMFRRQHSGPSVIEPRDRSWFSDDARQVLERYNVDYVVADPAPVPEAAEAGRRPSKLYYLRLHGSPRMYYSSYDETFLSRLAQSIQGFAMHREVWCVFDNTAEGHATANCLSMYERLEENIRYSALVVESE